MKCLADFEVISELSVSEDEGVISFEEANGKYSIRIRNKKIDDLRHQEILRLEIIFDSDTLEESEKLSLKYLTEALNLLALTTNSKFTMHRLVQIFDWTPDLTTRKGLIFAEDTRPHEPLPMLTNKLAETASCFLQGNRNKKIDDALRWFRLGIGAENIEEQFQNFWLALELVATSHKEPKKVYNSCPKCGGKLCCEVCGTVPKHKPYPKQAIQAIISQIAPDLPDFFESANKARNTIMHGGRLEELEGKINYTRIELVNHLGKITWDALLKSTISTLPESIFPFQPNILISNQYANLKLGAIAVIETVIQNGSDGEPDIAKGSGIKAKIQ